MRSHLVPLNVMRVNYIMRWLDVAIEAGAAVRVVVLYFQF
jgi:hypothetical protein